jgi:hypothetical protein
MIASIDAALDNPPPASIDIVIRLGYRSRGPHAEDRRRQQRLEIIEHE